MEYVERSYVVSVNYDYNDCDDDYFISFVTGYPVNSVGFWEDFYDACFALLDPDTCNHLRIVEIEEGFWYGLLSSVEGL